MHPDDAIWTTKSEDKPQGPSSPKKPSKKQNKSEDKEEFDWSNTGHSSPKKPSKKQNTTISKDKQNLLNIGPSPITTKSEDTKKDNNEEFDWSSPKKPSQKPSKKRNRQTFLPIQVIKEKKNCKIRCVPLCNRDDKIFKKIYTSDESSKARLYCYDAHDVNGERCHAPLKGDGEWWRHIRKHLRTDPGLRYKVYFLLYLMGRTLPRTLEELVRMLVNQRLPRLLGEDEKEEDPEKQRKMDDAYAIVYAQLEGCIADDEFDHEFPDAPDYNYLPYFPKKNKVSESS